MVEGVVEWFLTTHTLYEQSLVFKPPLCWKVCTYIWYHVNTNVETYYLGYEIG